MTSIPASSPHIRRRSLRATAVFVIVFAAIIIGPSMSLSYWQGWLYWALFSALSIIATLYFLKHDPALVERRLTAGPAAEAEPAQKAIMSFATICVVAIFALPGIDHLRGWSQVPAWLVLTANVFTILSYLFVCYVLASNSYAAATIVTQKDQPVITTGPYAYVRHPMYSAALLMFAFTPIALGSYWSLLLMIPLTAILAWRLIDEERVLIRDLPGYAAYRKKVRYRLVPGLW